MGMGEEMRDLIKNIGCIFCVTVIWVFFSFYMETNESENRSIYKYRTDYIGDNSKVSQIAGGMKYPDGVMYKSIEIQMQKEPYSLIVRLQTDQEVEEKSFFNNAVMTFALIGNLYEIEYENISTGETIGMFSRETVDKILWENDEKSCAEIGADKETFLNYEKNQI